MKIAISLRNTATTIAIMLCTLSLLLLPGCGQQSNNAMLGTLFLGAGGDKGGSTLITAEAGGVVQLNDEVTLTVPAEALPDDLTISIQRLSDIPAGDADGLTSFGQAYRFLPKGTGFDLGEPAVLEMHYDSAELARLGLSPETIQICYYDEDLKCYVPVNSFVDTAHNRVTALIEHFTVYLPMAQALLPTNNEPYVGLQAPWPTTIRAGAPIYVRATVRDYDGAVAGVTLRYRKLHGAGAGAWQEVRMTKQANPQAALHTYGYLIPASFLTADDIGAGNDLEYRVEATDNLGSVRTSGTRRYDVTLTYEPGSLTINPATLDIAAGFECYMLVRGVDNNGTAFSLVPETFAMAYAGAELENRFAQGILLRAVTQTQAGTPDQLIAGFDAESATTSVNIYAGELESIEVLDTNGISIPGDLAISEGTSYAFDVVGRDGYGNTIPIIPVWSADASIGIMSPDGVLDTTGCHGPGVVTASLAYSTDTQNVYVQSREKEITAFSINGVDGEIAYPFITVILPWGTDVTALVAQFSTTGTGVTVDDAAQESGVTANDFTDPVVYRVTAEDGSTQDYTVQVRMLSPYKDITAFSINGVDGVIVDTDITIKQAIGTDVTSLIAQFTTTGQSVTVNEAIQQSGVTVNDFTNPVVYIVTAEDGTTTQYTVTVHLFTGLVSHFAGSKGGAGYSDGIGTDAEFMQPIGITTDGQYCYIADILNHSIRRINTSTGEVMTFAGSFDNYGTTDGTGTTARFMHPFGITIDEGILYISDSRSNTIRKIVIATQEVSTIAGLSMSSGSADGTGSTARFNFPAGITCDGLNLYVADANNHTIRKIVIASGEVTTLAGLAGTYGTDDGTGIAARFFTPIGLTTDGVNLYVADTNNHAIRKIVIATAEVTTFAGICGSSGSMDGTGTEARLNGPNGITLDGGSLYVADSYNNSIRKIETSTSIVSTIAGLAGSAGSSDGNESSARFYIPRGISCNGNNLYITDSYNNTIRKLQLDTLDVITLAGLANESGYSDGIGLSARFRDPGGIANDFINFYITDSNNYTIRKIAADTGEVSTIAGTAGSRGSADGTGSSARFYGPRGIATDGSNLYITDNANHTVRKLIIETGVVTTIAGLAGNPGFADGSGTDARFYSPWGIAYTDGNIYIAEQLNHTIRKISVLTGEVTTFAGTAGISGSDDGIGLSARFYNPQGITTDGVNLYVSDTLNRVIRKIMIATSEVTTIAGSAGLGGTIDGVGSSARFNSLSDITYHGNQLYLTDLNMIRQINITTYEVKTIAGSYSPLGSYGATDGYGSAALFYNPRGLTVFNNNLYITDSSNNCIRIIE